VRSLLHLRGLRGRVVCAFGVGALLVSAIFAASTYGLALSYLLGQREHSALSQSYAHANFVRDRLETAGADVPTVLTAAGPSAVGGSMIVNWRDRWYTSSLEMGRSSIPAVLRQEVNAGMAASLRTRIDGAPRLIIGIPLPAVDATFYEVAPLDELQATLRVLGTILAAGALVAAAAGAGLGVWASRSVVRPLNELATTAGQVAAGQLDTRLAATRDPDLAAIVGSFNSMVDALQQRIERDARMAADVSHELRSPLTTLVASVDLLNRHRAGLSSRHQQALNLVTEELARFRHVLDNLLELARADAGVELPNASRVSIGELLSQALSRSGRPTDLLSVQSDAVVEGDKLRLERVFVNLFDNADKHGGGIVRVSVAAEEVCVLIFIDDSGPGVPREDRERIFDRFATGRTPRGSSSGTGLGLALVRETVATHAGAVWCTDRPSGGARFVVSLERADR
jgi:two-component system, OmpR family, sensor histidine kinase MtrB